MNKGNEIQKFREYLISYIGLDNYEGLLHQMKNHLKQAKEEVKINMDYKQIAEERCLWIDNQNFSRKHKIYDKLLTIIAGYELDLN
jgi:hypothetical protein